MEENVALDSSKQKQFVKSIKGIKKILKGKKTSKSKTEVKDNVKIGKVEKPKRKKTGLVYLSHIPHGFYEHQMTEYFKQFGVVTNARVIRSKRTGMSKGHAFVEFKDPNVAQIVAETMNNYLMGKRLIKAALIPPEKQRKFAKRKNWNAQNNPGNDLRQKMKKAQNSIKDESEELKIATRLLFNLNKTKKKLKELGIDYDFFTPVDVPESLMNLVEVKKEEDVDTAVIKKEEETVSTGNKKSKDKKPDVNKGETQDKTVLDQAANSASKNSKKSKKLQQSKINEKTNIVKTTSKDNNKDIKVSDSEKKTPKNKEGVTINKDTKNNTEKLKLKNTENEVSKDFIKIQNESDDDSDSSVDFDSDEFDRVMEHGDSDVQSDDESETEEELDEDITSDEDQSEEDEPSPPKKVKAAPALKIPAKQNKKSSQGKKVKDKKPPVKQPMPKMVQKESKPSKKPKFEKKGNKKTLNKVTKKKK